MKTIKVTHGDLTLKFYVQRGVCGKDLRGGRGCGIWLVPNVDVTCTSDPTQESLAGLLEAFKSRLVKYNLLTTDSEVGPFQYDSDDERTANYCVDDDDDATFDFTEISKMIEGMSDPSNWTTAEDGTRFCGFAMGGIFNNGACYHGGSKFKRIDLLNAVTS